MQGIFSAQYAEQLANNCICIRLFGQEEMERRAKLSALWESRWASQAVSLYTFRTAYPVAVLSLATPSEDGEGKARGYLRSIKQFGFSITFCINEHGRNARDILAKNSAFSFVRSRHTRTKWQDFVARKSFLRTISCSSKAECFQQHLTR